MDINHLFKNCLGVGHAAYGYRPLRFSGLQEQYYSGIDAPRRIRSRCPAGVSMDFITDQRELSFHYTAVGFARNGVTFDIYEDDILTSSVSFPDLSPSGVVTYARRSAEPGRITIYLPNTVELYVHTLDFGLWEPVPADDRKRWLFLGDSITQGMESMHPSFSFATLVSRYLQTGSLNQGVGGLTYDAHTLQPDFQYACDCITVAYGTNDFVKVENPDDIARNTERYFQVLSERFPHQTRYVITPLWRADIEPESAGYKKFIRISEIIRTIATDHCAHVIDGSTLIPHSPDYFTDHYLHPNDLGFHQMALNFLRNIRM